MKKYLICLTCVYLCFSLCGCSFFGSKTRDDRNFMVAAIGFETDGALITVSAETVIINSELPEAEPEPMVLTGTGTTVSEALDSIGSTLAKPMILNHCGVIVIGKRMTKYWFSRICDYCFNENRITLSAYMVSADSPAKLLSGKPESSVAVGYDIMGIIEQQSARTGISYNSRYFEVEGLREKGKKVFSLPHFIRNDGRIAVDGLSVFRDDAFVTKLDTEESEFYSLMTGNFKKGTLRLGAEDYSISLKRTSCDYSDNQGNNIILKMRLSGKKINNTALEKLEKELEDLENGLRLKYKEDIFGFCDALNEKFPEFKRKYGENYNAFYGSAHFSAECQLDREK